MAGNGSERSSRGQASRAQRGSERLAARASVAVGSRSRARGRQSGFHFSPKMLYGDARSPSPFSWNPSMLDFAAARRMMVDGQVRTSDVTDLRIIAAMLEIPRERFVPGTNTALAYLDLDVPAQQASGPAKRCAGCSSPWCSPRWCRLPRSRRPTSVLDVGCATGYSSALLARLAQSVVALEEDPALAQARGRESQIRRREQCDGRDRPVDARLAARRLRSRLLRRHFRQWRDRGRAARAMRAAQGGRPAARRQRSRPQWPGDGLSLGCGRRQRLADLRCRAPAASRLCQAACLRFLRDSALPPLHGCGAKAPSAGYSSLGCFPRGSPAQLWLRLPCNA